MLSVSDTFGSLICEPLQGVTEAPLPVITGLLRGNLGTRSGGLAVSGNHSEPSWGHCPFRMPADFGKVFLTIHSLQCKQEHGLGEGG